MLNGLDALNGLENFWGLEEETQSLDCDHTGRVLVQHSYEMPNRNLRDSICIFNKVWSDDQSVALSIIGAFDIETATGAQLDTIGDILNLKRWGFDDDDYRKFLKILRSIYRSDEAEDGIYSGTIEHIISIAVTIAGSPVFFQSLPPFSYRLTFPAVSPAETLMLLHLLCLATMAGVLGFFEEVPPNGTVWSHTDDVGGDVWAHTDDVVTTELRWGYVFSTDTTNGAC